MRGRLPAAHDGTMKKNPDNAEMRPEYDFSKGTRGKYAGRYVEGTNVVLLEPDVAAAFPDSEAVNRALRKAANLPAPSK